MSITAEVDALANWKIRAMPSNDLTTLPNALAWLGLESDDGADSIARLITAVSTAIQNFVSYNFATQGYDKTFDGKGTAHQMLPDRPVKSISLVQVNGLTVPQSTGAYNFGYVFTPMRVSLIGCKFSRGIQNIRIVYTAGMDQIPADVETAALMWIKACVDAKEVGANIQEYAAGDTRVKYQHSETIGKALVTPIPPLAYQKLIQYQRVSPV